MAKLNGLANDCGNGTAGPGTAAAAIDRRIRAFLDGETRGEDVLNALYGAALDEPVPARLSALLKR